jgi:hypothetical protein
MDKIIFVIVILAFMLMGFIFKKPLLFFGVVMGSWAGISYFPTGWLTALFGLIGVIGLFGMIGTLLKGRTI